MKQHLKALSTHKSLKGRMLFVSLHCPPALDYPSLYRPHYIHYFKLCIIYKQYYTFYVCLFDGESCKKKQKTIKIKALFSKCSRSPRTMVADSRAFCLPIHALLNPHRIQYIYYILIVTHTEWTGPLKRPGHYL
jgi:hypothetical protein